MGQGETAGFPALEPSCFCNLDSFDDLFSGH
jgi:hypothetical protein